MRKLCEEEDGILKSGLGFMNSSCCMAKVEDECMACFDWPLFGFCHLALK